eukprot:1159855-Pelagomonas_calceolata.AAC.9
MSGRECGHGGFVALACSSFRVVRTYSDPQTHRHKAMHLRCNDVQTLETCAVKGSRGWNLL